MEGTAMKKKYITPETEIVELNAKCPMLLIASNLQDGEEVDNQNDIY